MWYKGQCSVANRLFIYLVLKLVSEEKRLSGLVGRVDFASCLPMIHLLIDNDFLLIHLTVKNIKTYSSKVTRLHVAIICRLAQGCYLSQLIRLDNYSISTKSTRPTNRETVLLGTNDISTFLAVPPKLLSFLGQAVKLI